MLRTHTCGELKLSDVDKTVTLAGWVQRTRDKGGLLWIDLRDRYGITQLILDETSTERSTLETARQLGREYVIQAEGKVVERLAKNEISLPRPSEESGARKSGAPPPNGPANTRVS